MEFIIDLEHIPEMESSFKAFPKTQLISIIEQRGEEKNETPLNSTSVRHFADGQTPKEQQYQKVSEYLNDNIPSKDIVKPLEFMTINVSSKTTHSEHQIAAHKNSNTNISGSS